jgi:putative DNA primase/helicase
VTNSAVALADAGRPLTLSDYSRLEASFITRDVADAARLFRVDSADGKALVGSRRKGDHAGVAFPYIWPGETRPRCYRLRRDNPELERKPGGTLKEKDKYLSAPGDRNRLFFAPTVTPGELADAGVRGVVVEAEKKALALQRFFDGRGERVVVVGLQGVWNWKGVVGKATNGGGKRVAVKGVIPDFDRIEWRGRQVEIVFDADAASNDGVKAARRELQKELTRRGAQARILEMPAEEETGAKGIDDLLGLKGADYVAAWLERERAKSATKGRKTASSGAVFDVKDAGVFALDPEGGEPIFVCSPLFIEADTRDEQGRNWGRLLRWPDRDGREHSWAMPMELLNGDGREYRGVLLNEGLTVGAGRRAQGLLEQYLNTRPERKALCVSRVGWHRGAFILPDETIGGADGEEIRWQTAGNNHHLFAAAGTLDEWRREVAHYCAGNSRLAFAVSAAFAAALLSVVEAEGGGFHFRGASSLGKTTALLVGGSVWGGGSDKGYLRRWRATINGLESVAETHNDSLLCLDELAEVDPREAGEVAYMLANGAGKLRMSKGVTLRRSLEWRLLFLSSGETSLAEHIASAGKRSRGGQEVRLVDLEADAGKGRGLFDELHGMANGDALARHLQQASRRHYGTAIREFLRRVAAEPAAVRREARHFTQAFLKDYLSDQAGREAGRVAHRFALVGYAGELASECGVTGWTGREAEAAAAELFKDWCGRRGEAGTDEEAAIRQVRLFIEQHGASRFQRLDRPDDRTVHNRAGYIEGEDEETVWYILPEVFRAEVCKGFDVAQAAKSLERREWLLTSHNLRYEKRTPEGKKKLYAITRIFQE